MGGASSFDRSQTLPATRPLQPSRPTSDLIWPFPVSKHVAESPDRYSVAFKSNAQRISPHPAEMLALSYPGSATDSLDLSALAVSNRQMLSLTSSMSGSHGANPSFEFASTQVRPLHCAMASALV